MNKQWTFFTNHAHVLFCISRDADVRLRDVAATVGITERAAQRIVAELEEAGYLDHEHRGRRNHYEIIRDAPLRHSVERHIDVRDLLNILEPNLADR